MAWSLVPTANSLQLGKVKLECVSHLLFHNMLNLIQKKLLYIDPFLMYILQSTFLAISAAHPGNLIQFETKIFRMFPEIHNPQTHS